MSEKGFTLPINLKFEVESVDCISQHNNETISALAKAILRISDDSVVQYLAKHIDYLAQDSMNEVNVIAEQLGANYVGANSNH